MQENYENSKVLNKLVNIAASDNGIYVYKLYKELK